MAERVQAFSSGTVPADPQFVASEQRAPRPRDVYVYFDNDIKVRAPFDARSLAEALDD